MARLEKNGIRGNVKPFPIQIAKRLDDGRHQIGAASDRLGQDNVGAFSLLKPADFTDQVVESAAKAGPGHLFHRKALRPQTVGVHQVLGLVIGDEPHASTLVDVKMGQPADARGLARAQKAADHDEAKSFHGCIPRSSSG